MRRSSAIGRAAAIGAVLVAAVAVVVILMGGGKTYKVSALFQNASQLVNGNLVQVAGEKVGKVEKITLTDDGQARVDMSIDQDFAPLRQGTVATVRQSSLSGIANRYIDLRLGGADRPAIPDGGVISQDQTHAAVDLDQLFNVFGPKERRALSDVIRGSAQQYSARGKQMNRGLLYLNPNFAAASRLFRELNRDPDELRNFIGESSKLVTDVAAKRDDLAGLIDNLATVTGAIGRRNAELAESVNRLPDFMRRANTTFVNLRATLDDLDPLVEESKPVARRLRPFIAELRPLARDARPTIRDLSRLVRRAGPNNDLIELTRSNIPVRDIALGPVNENGREREGAFPASAKALAQSTPELAFARPYANDLTAWFDGFSHPGYYDALGGTSRIPLHVSLFSVVNGLPTNSVIPPDQRDEVINQVTSYQTNRCPGSMERPAPDRTNPWRPSPDYNCNPNEVPLGP